ncbi:MAG: hypothetical protein H8D24_07225 [Gammaproteobacteria bacterium]|uniref:Uncharacterized protein n=1 Tax=Candidatus Thiopontia autotrophica TaxID=2841688 RepID=A0A8J6NXZ1_9GAMM|nr:hypothetical protein [Candidatus Thiopontia autotrophica]MBL6968613.1 hypothetical protein [Gammaproteobacteria bacterium]
MHNIVKNRFHTIMDPIGEKVVYAVAVLMFTMFAVLAIQPVMILGMLLW